MFQFQALKPGDFNRVARGQITDYYTQALIESETQSEGHLNPCLRTRVLHRPTTATVLARSRVGRRVLEYRGSLEVSASGDSGMLMAFRTNTGSPPPDSIICDFDIDEVLAIVGVPVTVATSPGMLALLGSGAYIRPLISSTLADCGHGCHRYRPLLSSKPETLLLSMKLLKWPTNSANVNPKSGRVWDTKSAYVELKSGRV